MIHLHRTADDKSRRPRARPKGTKPKKGRNMNTSYIYVQKPLTDEKLARIGNHQKVNIHVSLPLDAIVGEQARGLKAEVESAVIADTTAWRLEGMSCQPYHVDSKHRIEFDVQARLERILRENEVDETVRIPFWQVMMTAPEAIEELIFNRLTTNGDNLVESYDSIKLVGTEEDDLVIRVKATTQVGD